MCIMLGCVLKIRSPASQSGHDVLLVVQFRIDCASVNRLRKLRNHFVDSFARLTPGDVTTRELDRFADERIRKAGGVAAFLNYKGFPATLCTALNDVIVHGFPDDRPLASGDIVGIDCGVMYKGYYGDAARTYAVGEASKEAPAPACG